MAIVKKTYSFLSLPARKVKLTHHMKNGDKSYETNAHDEDNIW